METAWAPRWTGAELRQARAAARTAHLASVRAAAEAAAARSHGDHGRAAEQEALADSYRTMHAAHEQRAIVFAVNMADRADWEQATRYQRQLALAADAELRRRHPDQPWPPLRSAEPEPAAPAGAGGFAARQERDLDALTRDVREVAARHREVATRLAARHSLMIPAEDPDVEAHEPAFPLSPRRVRGAILQPPMPQIPPSAPILQRDAWHEPDWEAAD